MSEYIKFGVYTRGEAEFSFCFNTVLTAKQKASFVNNVVSVVVDDNYYDFLTDIMFDFEIVDLFTDINLSEIINSENQIDAIETFLNETNVVAIVKENAEFGLIDELRNSIDKCIEYKTGIHRNIIEDSISRLLDTLDRKISDTDIDTMIKMAQVFSGVQGEFTAEKVLDAYSKSNMYKQNQKQVNNSPKKRSTKKSNLKVVKDVKEENIVQEPSSNNEV